MCDNADQNVPYSLFVSSPDFLRRCMEEDEGDVRHLGRYLTFIYNCPNCGPREVALTPDYPYVGPNTTWPCSHCAAVMRLQSVQPVKGVPKRVTLDSIIRAST